MHVSTWYQLSIADTRALGLVALAITALCRLVGAALAVVSAQAAQCLRRVETYILDMATPYDAPTRIAIVYATKSSTLAMHEAAWYHAAFLQAARATLRDEAPSDVTSDGSRRTSGRNGTMEHYHDKLLRETALYRAGVATAAKAASLVSFAAAYSLVIDQMRELARTAYDRSAQEHEEMLLRLWTALVPDRKLSNRVSKDWQDIGFQGNDPATDFRGGGILSLSAMLFLAQKRPDDANRFLRSSERPSGFYPFAVGAINIAIRLLNEAEGPRSAFVAERIFHKSNGSDPTAKDFFEVFCDFCEEFHIRWCTTENANVMMFNQLLNEAAESFVAPLQLRASARFAAAHEKLE